MSAPRVSRRVFVVLSSAVLISILAASQNAHAAEPTDDAAGAPTAEESAGSCTNVELVSMIERIRERSRELDRRDGELAARERSIAALEAKTDARLDQLEQLQKTLDRRLAEFVRNHGDRLDQLAKVYGRMPPKKAGPLVENLGLELAVQVVTRMKDKQIAALLADLSPPFAVRLSRLVARPLATASLQPADVAAPGRAGGTP